VYTNRKTKCTPEATRLHEINTEPALQYGRTAIRSAGKTAERDADIPKHGQEPQVVFSSYRGRSVPVLALNKWEMLYHLGFPSLAPEDKHQQQQQQQSQLQHQQHGSQRDLRN